MVSFMNKKELKRLDIILLILFPIISVILSLVFKANYLVSTLLFFGLPSVWLSYRTPHMIKRTALFAFIFCIPFGIIIDYIVTADKGWFVPRSSFPRIFNLVPIEDLIFVFLLAYAAVIFYEHFLDKGKHRLIDSKMKYFIWPVVILFFVFIILFFNNPLLLRINYAYFWLGGTVLLLPTLAALGVFPGLFSKYVKTASYFFIVTLLFEFTALELGQWKYDGANFIGWVNLFGHSFPIEEFFFCFILFSTAVLSYYEFFDEPRHR